MRCRFFNDFSYEWVQEKRDCINPNEMERARRIERLYREKVEAGPRYFTAEEFSEFLKFKGLARSVPAFLRHYQKI
jgi:hypothetical protein